MSVGEEDLGVVHAEQVFFRGMVDVSCHEIMITVDVLVTGALKAIGDFSVGVFDSLEFRHLALKARALKGFVYVSEQNHTLEVTF